MPGFWPSSHITHLIGLAIIEEPVEKSKALALAEQLLVAKI